MRKTTPIGREDEHRRLLDRFGRPFAVALAVFLRELAADERGCGEAPLTADRESASLPGSWEELPEDVRAALEAEITQDNTLLATGELGRMELTEDSPAEAMANRIRRRMREKRISQRELAGRMSVSASFISKVLKDPTRSRLDTLQRIAVALDTELRTLV